MPVSFSSNLLHKVNYVSLIMYAVLNLIQLPHGRAVWWAIVSMIGNLCVNVKGEELHGHMSNYKLLQDSFFNGVSFFNF